MYLNTHSYYSLRYGTLPPDVLASMAAERGIDTLVLTDINNTSGTFDFVKACRQKNITPLTGIEFREDNRLLYTGIALNVKGFGELNRFLSYYRLLRQPLPPSPPAFHHAVIVWPFGIKNPSQLAPNEYVGVRHHQLPQLVTSSFRRYTDRLLIWQPVTFANRQGAELHRHLRAIDRNILLNRVGAGDVGTPYDWMVPPGKLMGAYKDWPGIVKATEKLIAGCSFDFDFNENRNKSTYTGSRRDDETLLKQLALDGVKHRYGAGDTEALKRVENELTIINNMGFAAYFLIAWDIIRYSMSRGFYHVGRGSGANSVVAYCLKITDVDPIELNLYFERFLNPKRSSPPDFDIDYSWRERDEVQQYIFKRYGQAHTAFLGATSTFQARAAIRELGKVYGLPKEDIDRLAVQRAASDSHSLEYKIVQMGQAMEGMPNLRTIHAGGILISQAPITDYTALDLPPKGLPTTQWDMYVAEEIGFEKFDILSQRGIGHIRECVDLVYQNRSEKVDIHRVQDFKNDEQVKELLRRGETNGCFYVESPAMRGLLKKLKCDNYITLVAASSIIRPGVARSGMMREYIQRFHNPAGVHYLHPVMKQQLEETYGVMVYQEDVIKVCHHFAGLDLAESDVLRRAMSGKFRSKNGFQVIVDKFFENCRRRGYSETLIAEVWRQIESFAGYSFSKAHSASYAVESFQSLYLKARYPLEFMVAVINNFGGFYATWVYVNEACRWGANIHLPCVNHSGVNTSIKERDIYLGFIHLQGLEQQMMVQVETERKSSGAFRSLEDFYNRLKPGKSQMVLLVRVGAFRFTGKSKAELLWQVHLFGHKERGRGAVQKPLLQTEAKSYKMPAFEFNKLEDAYDEIELLGFPLSLSLFDMLQSRFRGEVMARDMVRNTGRVVRMLGRLVTIKPVKTVNGKLMQLATFVDVEGEFFDTVHFPDVARHYPFRGAAIYLILGKITEDFGYPSLEVQKMAPMPIRPDPRCVYNPNITPILTPPSNIF